MQLRARFYFRLYTLEPKERVDNVLRAAGITEIPPYPSQFLIDEGMPHTSYDFDVDYDPVAIQVLLDQLAFIEQEEGGEDALSFSFRYHFDDSDYAASPLFVIDAIGEQQDRYLFNKGKYKERLFCSTCNRTIEEQTEPLKINTAKIDKYDVIYVDSKLVISEKMAKLFAEWELTGYRLEPVLHTGTERTKKTAYQVVPTNLLPPQELPVHMQTDPFATKQKCPACGMGAGHLTFPFHYRESVREQMQDFNTPREWIGNHWIVRYVLVSDKVKRLLLESGIAKGEARREEERGDHDWVFQPVVIVAPSVE